MVDFKEAFHDGDLEPGSSEKHSQVKVVIDSMLKTPHWGKTDWVLYIAELLAWLKIRADYDEYTSDPRAPWPHSFVVQDMVQAFVTMAMFFPESEAAASVMTLFRSEEWEKLRNSAIFDPRERSKTLPDRRSRTSYKFRDPKFWTPWKDLGKSNRYYADIYPLDWSLAVRPIVAKCQYPFSSPPTKLHEVHLRQ